MIVTVEHTCGGKSCACCHRNQEFVTERQCGEPVNIKMQTPWNVSRLRLCATCSKRLQHDLNLALGGAE
jgi:hypothetical protein